MDVRWLWIFLDVPSPAASVWQFWAAATRSRVGPTRGQRQEFATLEPAAGDAWLKVQEVAAGGGVHLDLDVADPSAAAERAVALGARVARRVPGEGYVVLRSPGGFIFCLTTWEGAGHQIRVGEADLLDQLCLSVDAEAFEAEVSFWAGLTGIAPVRGSREEFAVLPRPAGWPVRILVQRRQTPGGPGTGHPDFACADRARTRAEHEALGARHTGEGERWSVMTAPGGQVYCLTDRRPATGALSG